MSSPTAIAQKPWFPLPSLPQPIAQVAAPLAEAVGSAIVDTFEKHGQSVGGGGGNKMSAFATKDKDVNDHLGKADALGKAGKWADASAEYKALGLPRDENADSIDMKSPLGKTIVAVGEKDKIAKGEHAPKLKELQGKAYQADLLADMQKNGVSPSNPPTKAELDQYLAKAPSKPDAYTKIAQGTQVHYSEVGAAAPAWKKNDPQLFVLGSGTSKGGKSGDKLDGVHTDASGQPMTFKSAKEAEDYAKKNKLDLKPLEARTTVPDQDQIQKAKKSGAQNVTNCEAETATALNTFGQAPGCKPLGAVYIRPNPESHVGHAMAVVQGPDGHAYVCNGNKPPVKVPGKPPTHAAIMSVVEAEAKATYSDDVKSFTYSVGKGSTPMEMQRNADMNYLCKNPGPKIV